MKRPSTTGELRAILMQTIKEVRAGTIANDSANLVAKVAGRLNESIAVEAKAALVILAAGGKPPVMGQLVLGEGDVDSASNILELSDEDLGRHVRELVKPNGHDAHA